MYKEGDENGINSLLLLLRLYIVIKNGREGFRLFSFLYLYSTTT